MKKLIIVALAIAAATTMYAQGTCTVSMVSDTVVTYGDSCGALAGTKVGEEITANLMYQGQILASQAFAMSSKGAPTGKLKGDVFTTALPYVGDGTVNDLTIQAINPTDPLYKGESNPFTYKFGNSVDPTAMPDGKMVYDAFTVDYIVPEPTTIALGILGLSSLLVFRRRD